MSEPREPILRVDKLVVSFRVGKMLMPAVRGVSFDVALGQTVALVGESGSGKSVTAMSILRLLPDNAVVGPESQIRFFGRDVLTLPGAELRALRGKDIAVVFQEPMTSLNPVFTVGDQVAEVLRVHLGMNRKQAFSRAAELLDEVGIPHPKERLGSFPHELSGGQQQRVMIAMAIACEPKLLIADEPTTALDVTVQKQILELLANLKARHAMSLLFITHDLGVVGEIADRVVVMRSGEVRESTDKQSLFSSPSDPYTRALLACRPTLDQRPRRLPVIESVMRGEVLDMSPRALATPGRTILEVKGLRKEYRLKTGGFWGTKTVEAVKDVSFTVDRGRTLGIVGESGSGKTTIGMLLMRLAPATRGEVWWRATSDAASGVDLLSLSERAMMAYRRKLQIVFQNPYASLNPRFTVGRILVEPMRVHRLGENDEERYAEARKLLDQVGLPAASLHKYPHEFSGGQRQRIAIARCLSLKPEVLICDESVSALDVSVQATVLNLLLDLQETYDLTYVFISHDLAVIRTIADDILVMSQGEVVERGSAEAIYGAPAHDYTKRLLAAVPRGFVAT